jgi:hypothetical protein
VWLEAAMVEWRGAGDPRAALEVLRTARAAAGGSATVMAHAPLRQAWAELVSELSRAQAADHEDYGLGDRVDPGQRFGEGCLQAAPE